MSDRAELIRTIQEAFDGCISYEYEQLLADKILQGDFPQTRHHKPVGAYLPVGQLDGDCSCGKGTWPCVTLIREVFSA